MSKSVLVIDTSEDCESCVLHGGIFHSFCKINCRDIADYNVKPDWCPLKPLPDKLTYENSYNDYRDGWNDCIDVITGKEK